MQRRNVKLVQIPVCVFEQVLLGDQIVLRHEDLPLGFEIQRIDFDYRVNCFVATVAHASFPAVGDGEIPPTIGPLAFKFCRRRPMIKVKLDPLPEDWEKILADNPQLDPGRTLKMAAERITTEREAETLSDGRHLCHCTAEQISTIGCQCGGK